MNRAIGMKAFLLAALLVPLVASADGGRDEARYGEECYEHKGKIKCRGGKVHQRHRAGGPPPWAPAHGWRRKQEGADHEVYSRQYPVEDGSGIRAVIHGGSATVDVGIDRGTCNREAIGTVLGGLIGGAIGNRTGSHRDREVTTVLGAVIGGLIGNNIGRSMDEADQQCTGQVLEQAPDHHTVRWTDEARNGEYRVTPERTYEADGRYCRDYLTEYRGDNEVERERASACRNQEGVWQNRVM